MTLIERLRELGFSGNELVNQLGHEAADELEVYETLFELQRKADERAVKRWRDAHPDKEHILPDRADMVVWLMEEHDKLVSSSAGIVEAMQLADEYEAGLRKMEASGYEEFSEAIPKHKLVIKALRALAQPLTIAEKALEEIHAQCAKLGKRQNETLMDFIHRIAAQPPQQKEARMTEAEIKKAEIGDRVMYKPLSADAGEYSEGTITHKLGSRVEITWDDGEVSVVSPHDYTRIFLKRK